MNLFDKQIAILMIIRSSGEFGITQEDILSITDFISQPSLSMTLSNLSNMGYVTKKKVIKTGKGTNVNYKLTDKSKNIFGVVDNS